VAILLACRPFPADVVLKMLDSLASMPSECRELVYQQANSSDLHDQDTALTMALRDTPPPDPAAILIVDIVRLLRRLGKGSVARLRCAPRSSERRTPSTR